MIEIKYSPRFALSTSPACCSLALRCSTPSASLLSDLSGRELLRRFIKRLVVQSFRLTLTGSVGLRLLPHSPAKSWQPINANVLTSCSLTVAAHTLVSLGRCKLASLAKGSLRSPFGLSLCMQGWLFIANLVDVGLSLCPGVHKFLYKKNGVDLKWK